MGAGIGAIAVALAGCMAAPVEVSGSGTITVSWQNLAERGPSGSVGVAAWGDAIVFCLPSQSPCTSSNWSYAFLPAVGSASVEISAGAPVKMPDFSDSTLPAGEYLLQAIRFVGFGSLPIGDPASVVIAGSRDLSIWHQSVGRESADSRCPAGWQSSWAQWPGEGAGGFVCNAYSSEGGMDAVSEVLQSPDSLW